MKINFIPEALRNLRGEFVKNGFDLRLVGGIVRDTIVGLPSKDIDLCTNASPDQQIEVYNKAGVRYLPTGLDHGTLTVMLGEELFEITSLRIDVETDGRHAKVAFTDNWEADLARRDLTFNAMSMTFDGELFDPFHGQGDLCSGYVKFVGDAGSRIREDYLRILRWYRFMGRFGNIMNIDQFTKDCISFNAEGLKKISGERIWSEMKRIVTGKHAHNLLELMDQMGVAKQIGMYPMFSVMDRQASFEVTKGFTNDPELLIAAWLGWDRTNILRISERWKWSTAERTHVLWLAEHIGQNSDLRRLIAIENVNRQWVRELAAFELRDGWEQNAMAEWVFSPFPVSGDDLIALGFKPGKVIGEIIKDLKEAWAMYGYSSTKAELLDMVTRP